MDEYAAAFIAFLAAILVVTWCAIEYTGAPLCVGPYIITATEVLTCPK